MATKSSNIIATDLDFDAIATNIKTYPKSQLASKGFENLGYQGSSLRC